uniref:L-Fucosyltransferase n=1 Tax=Plectus sambesii TaxID=2011161 RepID=A0A914X4Y2_9BILA
MALDYFDNDTGHHICVHIRREDFMLYGVYEYSTENFTRASVLYLRAKLHESGKNTTVAILGDDRLWAQALFANDTWIRVPTIPARPTTDYAFFARHCHTILLTASASTFGFWSAYISSAEIVYYNVEYAMDKDFQGNFVPADIFPPTWIPLQLNSSNNVITEVAR